MFGLGGSKPAPKKEETAPVVAQKKQPVKKQQAPPAKKTAVAPRGVPTISNWKLNGDNTISGFISGSSSFNNGSPVTTSPIAGNAASNSVVQTKSQSKYFLGEQSKDDGSGGGLFGGLFGGAPSTPAPQPAATVAAKQTNPAAEAAAKRKQAAAEAAEARKQAAAEAQAKKQAEVSAGWFTLFIQFIISLSNESNQIFMCSYFS